MRTPIAKQILDRWASVVIPQSGIGYDPNNKSRPYFVKARWKSQPEKYDYRKLGFRPDLCLWVPPKDCLRIEFEGTPEQNNQWIQLAEEKSSRLAVDYCVCSHQGKSPYLWVFNIAGLENAAQRKQMSLMLTPKNSVLDRTNLGDVTLVPIVGLPHWKHRHVHAIVRGKNPLEHRNKLPEHLRNLKDSQTTLSKPQNPPPSPCEKHYDEPAAERREYIRIVLDNPRIQSLLAGNIDGFVSPSEARMSLIFSLCHAHLDDSEICWIMSRSSGLHWNSKPHLRRLELARARSVVHPSFAGAPPHRHSTAPEQRCGLQSRRY